MMEHDPDHDPRQDSRNAPRQDSRHGPHHDPHLRPHHDPRIDAYIAKAGAFAQPILTHLRGLAHLAEAEAQEGLRWGMPYFILEGRQLCGLAAFKAHCVFVIDGPGGGEAMGEFGRITSLDDLPADNVLITMIQDKAARIRSGEDRKAKSKQNPGTNTKVGGKPKAALAMPEDFAQALAQTQGAQSVWDNFTHAQRRDYLEWVTGAKREATREKRKAIAAEWIGEGKRRNWKYEKC